MLALTGYEIALATVALVFVAFALIVALVIPRTRPDFPGGRLGVFIGICVALFLVQMGAVLALAELGESDEHAEAAPPAETTPTEPTVTEPPTETAPPETPTETASGDVAAGKEVFLAQCGSCHTLADAGTTGSIGPSLDAAQPSLELAIDRVTNGKGAMPSFAGTLSEEQIRDVAAYVSSVAGR